MQTRSINTPSTIGIYGASGQSGKAFFADLLSAGVPVYGYARPSEHGRAEVAAVAEQGGIYRERPEGCGEPPSTLVAAPAGSFGHDLERLAACDVIIFSHPSVYHEQTATELRDLVRKRRVPLVLSPSRTLGTPHLFQILGEGYPIISFQTCPYACKTFRPGAVFVKQRKRAWVASVEGRTRAWTVELLERLFPQIVFSRMPATTSLGNIGAVFHPAAYLMNLPAIEAARAAGRRFSFYMEGIAHNPEVAAVVARIDQTRLRIARAFGCSVFGLDEDPGEEDWAHLMERVWHLERLPASTAGARTRARLRASYLQPIHDAVVSAQHWLAYTYGVQRIPGESLADAIARTPNYQVQSYAQARYAHEDVPVGLVPLEALAERMGIEHTEISRTIDLYNQITGDDARRTGRHLKDFSTDYLRWYLLDGTAPVTIRGGSRWRRSAC